MNRWMQAGLAATLMTMPMAAVSAQDAALMKNFTIADLGNALDGMNATYVDASDSKSINITFESTLKANGTVMACDDDDRLVNCFGTSILAIFEPAPGTTDQQVADAINEYNYRENFGRAYRDPSGDISVRIYIIADGGITRENYRRQIELWSQSLEYFTTYLYPQTDKKKGG